jgi:hypothetical protein
VPLGNWIVPWSDGSARRRACGSRSGRRVLTAYREPYHTPADTGGGTEARDNSSRRAATLWPQCAPAHRQRCVLSRCSVRGQARASLVAADTEKESKCGRNWNDRHACLCG